MKTNSLTPSPRRGRSLLLPLALGASVALLGGCATEPDSHVVSTPPPGAPGSTAVAQTGTATVYTTPAPAQGQSTVVVTQAPPTPQTETVSERPSSSHVWVAGYWTWRNNRYEWVAGHWAVPPHAGATWIPPRWVPEGGAYRFYEGYWE